MSLDDLNLPKENLFKITCRDGHDSPNYTFDWELTPKGAAVLQDKGVRFPFVYVLALEEIKPKKVDTHSEGCGCDNCTGWNKIVDEHLFCLHEGAGQIQFHREGTFRIYVMVIWYDDTLLARSHSNWKKHREKVLDNLNSYRLPIINEHDSLYVWSLQHVEEGAVHISKTFFAKPPNPKLWWWANLWWSSKPKNTCDYKKRILFVLWLQLITVSLYVLIRGLLLTLSYIGLLFVGLRPSSFSIQPMIHPFSSVFKQLCNFEDKRSNYALYDSDGKFRKFESYLVRLPATWVVIPTILYLLGNSIYHNPKWWMWMVIWTATSVVGMYLIYRLASWVVARNKSVVLYYEQVPSNKPKKARVTVKMRWLDAKGKLCLPFPE